MKKMKNLKELYENLVQLYADTEKEVENHKVGDYKSPIIRVILDFEIKTYIGYDFEKNLFEVELYELYNNRNDSLICYSDCPQKIFDVIKIRKLCNN